MYQRGPKKKKKKLLNSGPNVKDIKQIEEWLKTTASVCVFVCLGGEGRQCLSFSGSRRTV